MYIHLGESTVVKKSDVVGIFDLEKTSIEKGTRRFLKEAQEKGEVINVSMDLPRSFVVCIQKGKTVVYISQISTVTLLKRSDIF